MDPRRRGLCARLQHIVQIVILADQEIPPPDPTSQGVGTVDAAIPTFAHLGLRLASSCAHHAGRQQERQSNGAGGIDTGRTRPSTRARLRVRRGIGKELHKRREGILRRGQDPTKAAPGCDAAGDTEQHRTASADRKRGNRPATRWRSLPQEQSRWRWKVHRPMRLLTTRCNVERCVKCLFGVGDDCTALGGHIFSERPFLSYFMADETSLQPAA